MERRLIKTYKNGTKVWGVQERCLKCNGTGVIPEYFHIQSGCCFDCNGTGTAEAKEYEYTPERLAQLEAQKAKKAAKAAAEAEARRIQQEAEEAARKAEEEAWKAKEAIWEAKRRGHYFGEIGQKIEMEVTFTGFSDFETMYGVMNVYRFDTDDGAHLVWKSGAVLGGDEWLINEGDRITIKATIKDHKEYRGIEQTELQRVKVIKAVHKNDELIPVEE